MVVSGAGKCNNEIGEPMVPIALATGHWHPWTSFHFRMVTHTPATAVAAVTGFISTDDQTITITIKAIGVPFPQRSVYLTRKDYL